MGSSHSITMFSIVSRAGFMSWRLTPSTARPMDAPCPSVKGLPWCSACPVDGVAACILPSREGLGHRPIHTHTISDPSLSIHRTASCPLTRVSGRLLLPLTPESGRGRWSRAPNPWGPVPSAGIQSAERRKWHRHIPCPVGEGGRCRRDACGDVLGAVTEAWPTVHPKSGNR